jgi:hypothetical protein
MRPVARLSTIRSDLSPPAVTPPGSGMSNPAPVLRSTTASERGHGDQCIDRVLRNGVLVDPFVLEALLDTSAKSQRKAQF